MTKTFCKLLAPTLLVVLFLSGCEASMEHSAPPLSEQPVPTRMGGGKTPGPSERTSSLDGVHTVDEAVASFVGEKGYDHAGLTASIGGDLDGDGLADVVIGASWADEISGVDGGRRGKAYEVLNPGSENHELLYADLRLAGRTPMDAMGYSVSSSGDLNGDGMADLVVSAPQSGVDITQCGPGRVYVFYGPLSGRPGGKAPDAMFIGEEFSGLGVAVSSAGDVNGDGFDDLLMSATLMYDYAGAVYLFYGPFSGSYSTAEADVVILPSGYDYRLGGAVASGGDLNGDGFDDVVIGTPDNSQYGCASGLVRIFYGPLAGQLTTAEADATLYSTRPTDFAGSSLSSGGDVNGDGFDDLFIGARGGKPYCPTVNDPEIDDRGFAYLVYGPIGGTLDLARADATIEGHAARDYTGFSVSIDGDVDGDGYHDLLVGASGDDSAGEDAGAVSLFYGPVKGWLDMTEANGRILASFENSHVGNEVASGGDVDGDGYQDVLIGAPGGGPKADSPGVVYLFHGGPRSSP